jgi:hypothetical protein
MPIKVKKSEQSVTLASSTKTVHNLSYEQAVLMAVEEAIKKPHNNVSLIVTQTVVISEEHEYDETENSVSSA